MTLSDYDQWLLETAQDYPVTVLHGYADDSGNFSDWSSKDWPERLKQLNNLRYNRLYDEANRLPALAIPDIDDHK